MGGTGGASRGASTLPMQLAAFLAPELARPGHRNWLAKPKQMRAGQALAANWTHEQMPEAYLNLVPLRGEAQGIGARANSLVGQRPAQPTPPDRERVGKG